MNRLRVAKNFNKRSAQSNSMEPKRKFFFAFEGNSTEPDYFRGLEKYRDHLNFNKLIELVILDRESNDTLSHPKHILTGTIEALNSGEYVYDSEIDEVWLIFDRDKQNVSTEQLNNIIEECKSKKYKIGLSNPTFEFWLLCHFDKVNDLSKDEMLENRKISNRHNFISRELTALASHGYNKNHIKFADFKEEIDIAVSNSKSFATDIESLKTDLGTNMAMIIEGLRRD